MTTVRERANQLAYERMCAADPVLTDVQAALDVIPGMTPGLILTSGPSAAFDQYVGGQRNAIVYGALYEGLATDEADAVRKLSDGTIRVEGCHDHGCVGSVAGVYTASMPVFVVTNRVRGNVGFCNFYEGESRKRLNYGSYDDGVRDQLRFIEQHIAPVIGQAGVPQLVGIFGLDHLRHRSSGAMRVAGTRFLVGTRLVACRSLGEAARA